MIYKKYKIFDNLIDFNKLTLKIKL